MLEFFNSPDVKRNYPRILGWMGIIVSIGITLRVFAQYLFLMVNQLLQIDIQVPLLGDPNNATLYGLIFNSVWLIGWWLYSTKIERFKTYTFKRNYLFVTVGGVLFSYLWWLTEPIVTKIIPYFTEHYSKIDEKENPVIKILVAENDSLYNMFILIPVILIVMVLLWISGHIQQHYEDFVLALEDFEFVSNPLQKFSKLERAETWPDVELGKDVLTNEVVTIPGRDRTLNMLIVGSIGTGKTASQILPLVAQDMNYFVKFVNEFDVLYEREDYDTEDVKGRQLNGLIIIEPSNDLCEKAYQLAKARGIPDDCIIYVNPLDPNTPNINPMKGPVDRVAETLAMVMEGLNEGGKGNPFFDQAQRNHLKQYVYLLKIVKEDAALFDDLIDMYNSPDLVRTYHEQLQNLIPSNFEDITDRDQKAFWRIAKGIDEWFRLNNVPERDNKGFEMKHTDGPYRGQIKYKDAQATYVQGLRNQLNDIAGNTLVRRVLFGDSDFSFDVLLEVGGILLVNTAKGEIAGLSNIFGKLMLLSAQNAVFRRKPMISPFFSIYVDETADYMYQSLREFPAQSRKYKAITILATQTIAQFSDRYGQDYMHTLLATLRNKLVFADVSTLDSRVFSELFGETTRFKEGTSEQSISPLQENPMSRTGFSYSKEKEASFSAGQLLLQREFVATAKIVKNNRSMPARQVKANFVPKEDFIQSKHQLKEEKLAYWLTVRKQMENTLRQSINSRENQVDDLTAATTDIEETVTKSRSIEKEPQKINHSLQNRSTVHVLAEEDSVFIGNRDTIPIIEKPRKEYKMDTVHTPIKSNVAPIMKDSPDILPRTKELERFEEKAILTEKEAIVTRKREVPIEKATNIPKKESIQFIQKEEEDVPTISLDNLFSGKTDDIKEEKSVEQIPNEAVPTTKEKPKQSDWTNEQEDFLNSVINYLD